MLLDQKWDVSETNHHIAFIKDCNCIKGKLVTGKLNKWYIHLYLQCRLISQTIYLKKVIFFAWGQRPADNVQPLTALQDVNSQKRCSRLLFAHLQVQVFGWFVCFLKVFFWKDYGFLSPAIARSHDVKTSENIKLDNVTADNADAAVMSTRQRTTQAFIFYYLSTQKVNAYLIVTLDSANCFHAVKSDIVTQTCLSCCVRH